MVNKTAALENAETSSVGRALAMMGIGVLDSVASADEMVKAGAYQQEADSNQSYGMANKDEVNGYEDEPSGLSATCATCGAKMVEKHGNTNGKQWNGLFCPNAKKGTPGHKPVWL